MPHYKSAINGSKKNTADTGYNGATVTGTNITCAGWPCSWNTQQYAWPGQPYQMLDYSHQQHYDKIIMSSECWKLISSKVWCCVTGRAVPSFTKNHLSDSSDRVKQSMNFLAPMMKALQSFVMSEITHLMTQHEISEKLNLSQHLRDNLKPHIIWVQET